MKINKPPVIFLLGPTASGKTERAIQWVQGYLEPPFKDLEIISVDAVMVYRGMDIGTGKPTAEELLLAPHHLINIREPHEPYSVAEFRRDALKLIADIITRGKTPLLVGGTMLYVRALQQGLSLLPEANKGVREKLFEEGEALGWKAMHRRLARIDPKAALRIHPNDPQRIQRALEVYELTGRPMSQLLSPSSTGLEPYEIQIFALAKEALEAESRGFLHDRIATRFREMLSAGWVEEVKVLVQSLSKERPDYKSLPAMRAVGYRQVSQYLEGDLSYEEMVYHGIAATRQLAKRQLTAL
jgi:tRNA dimethylallyltransferase